MTAPRTTKPLDEALPTLLAERDVSLRALAERIEVDPGHLSKAIRRLEGKRPTRALLERIAAALELDPAFFPEYRHELVVEALESEPELRDELYRRLVKPERAGKPRTRRQA